MSAPDLYKERIAFGRPFREEVSDRPDGVGRAEGRFHRAAQRGCGDVLTAFEMRHQHPAAAKISMFGFSRLIRRLGLISRFSCSSQ
ncbi:hypothetical protein M3484_20630 [Pseudomonas sp. GX19020]|nr:hypothetical protein [Pseudomonas sp. GX19020]MCL4068967.1 hypothetical protein [Pseudomonas sp. GX19020]